MQCCVNGTAGKEKHLNFPVPGVGRCGISLGTPKALAQSCRGFPLTWYTEPFNQQPPCTWGLSELSEGEGTRSAESAGPPGAVWARLGSEPVGKRACGLGEVGDRKVTC